MLLNLPHSFVEKAKGPTIDEFAFPIHPDGQEGDPVFTLFGKINGEGFR